MSKTKMQLIREFNCKSQSEFAEWIGTTQACISQIESGKRTMSTPVIKAIQDVTKLPFEVIAGENTLPEADFCLLMFEYTLKKCTTKQIKAIEAMVDSFVS